MAADEEHGAYSLYEGIWEQSPQPVLYRRVNAGISLVAVDLSPLGQTWGTATGVSMYAK